MQLAPNNFQHATKRGDIPYLNLRKYALPLAALGDWARSSSGRMKELQNGLGIEPTDLALLHADASSDGMTYRRKQKIVSENTHVKVGLSPRCAMRNRRARRFVVDISEDSPANATAPYLLTAMARVVCIRGNEAEFSFSRVKVHTYTSNWLTSADVHIQEGAPIFGILLPTFGDYVEVTFDTCGGESLPPLGKRRTAPACLCLRCRSRPMVVGALTFARRCHFLRKADCPAHHRFAHKTSDARSSRAQCPHVREHSRTHLQSPLSVEFRALFWVYLFRDVELPAGNRPPRDAKTPQHTPKSANPTLLEKTPRKGRTPAAPWIFRTPGRL